MMITIRTWEEPWVVKFEIRKMSGIPLSEAE